jgi:nickel transport protein
VKSCFLHRIKIVAASMALLTVLAAPALAHRVNIFAYVEGDEVVVECSYSRSERVRLGDVEVFDAASGAALLAGKTDDKGEFRFPVPPAVRAAKGDLRIVLKAGEGHQNATEVKAAEYLSATPVAAPTTSAAPVATSAASASPSPAAAPVAAAGPVAAATAPVQTVSQTGGQGASAPALDAAALERIVEAAVEKKIAPLRAMLVGEKEKGPGLTEIVGGLGWLVGLAGIAAYFAAKGKKPRS